MLGHVAARRKKANIWHGRKKMLWFMVNGVVIKYVPGRNHVIKT